MAALYDFLADVRESPATVNRIIQRGLPATDRRRRAVGHGPLWGLLPSWTPEPEKAEEALE